MREMATPQSDGCAVLRPAACGRKSPVFHITVEPEARHYSYGRDFFLVLKESLRRRSFRRHLRCVHFDFLSIRRHRPTNDTPVGESYVILYF